MKHLRPRRIPKMADAIWVPEGILQEQAFSNQAGSFHGEGRQGKFSEPMVFFGSRPPKLSSARRWGRRPSPFQQPTHNETQVN